MKDLILKYYESEMRYLREAGKEFAKIHPDRAHFLNLDRVGDRDPYVERLFEGFAFLTGRLRQKIDDDLPELTENLVSLLWPHYMRLIPSLSIISVKPDFSVLSRNEIIEEGMEIESQPVGVSATRCRYRTTQDIIIRPISIKNSELKLNSDGRHMICMRVSFSELTDFEQLDLSSLRIYLNADAPIASMLHYMLIYQVATIYTRDQYSSDRRPMKGEFVPGGFSAEDCLWLKPENAFSGYQLLLEYFAFREKFMFVDLHGLENLNLKKGCEYIDIEIVLNQSWPNDMPFTHENFQLHCVPVINLFEMEADPIVVNQLESEYLLRPLLQQDGHVEIYSVKSIEAITQTGRYEYTPFTSFRHKGGMLRHDVPERFYHTRVKKSASGLHDTWLILGGKIWNKNESLEKETLSLQVVGTNGMLPRKALRNTLLNKLISNKTGVKSVKNLCTPTMPCYPPSEDRFHWRVLSHLAPNYLSLMDAEVLKGTLALYDWTDNELNARKLKGIINVEHKIIKRIEKGMMQRGVEIEITLNSHQFSGEGDVMLFGELLNHFFESYSDLNLFTQLSLIILPQDKKILWKSSKTSKAPL